MTSFEAAERLHAFDWLRSCAFILLLWVHAAQLHLPEGWHLHLTLIPALSAFVDFFRPWRMHLVFLVSGVALSCSFDRRSGWQFLANSAKRLLPPLVFGVLVLIPPVLVFELRDAGQEISLSQAYVLQARRLASGDFTWYIFWYLGYLFAFCCAAALLWSWYRRPISLVRNCSFSSQLVAYVTALALAIPLVLIELLLAPHFPVRRDFISDVASVSSYFVVFCYGATAMRNREFVAGLARYCWVSLALATLIYVLRLAELSQPSALGRILDGLNRWLWMIFFAGIAMRFFNRDQQWVRGFNGIVFPFYLVHQVVILATASVLRDQMTGLPLYFAISIISSLLSVAFVHVVLLRLPPPLHGLVGITAGEQSRQRRRNRRATPASSRRMGVRSKNGNGAMSLRDER